MALRTLVATPTFDITRRSVTKTLMAEYGAPGLYHNFALGERPAYQFTLKLEPMYRYAAEQLEAFHAFHQGAQSFFFSGGPYEVVDHYQLFDEGDGSRTQFFLPNRYIQAGSFSIQTRNQGTQATSIWATNAYSINLTPGLVVFGTAPNSGFDLEAIYACKYRCMFEQDGFGVDEFAKGIFRATINIRETFIFT